MCNKVCNCQFSMASDDRNCGSSWRRFGQVSHQAGPSGSLHCLAARHSVTAMASSILAVSKYRNMFFFKYIFFQYCFMLCAYASHVLSIDRAEKELEGFSCRLNPFHCGIGYCGIVVAQYCGIGYWGIAVLGIVALVIVQTESIPSSRDNFHSHVQVGSNRQKSWQFSCKSHEQKNSGWSNASVLSCAVSKLKSVSTHNTIARYNVYFHCNILRPVRLLCGAIVVEKQSTLQHTSLPSDNTTQYHTMEHNTKQWNTTQYDTHPFLPSSTTSTTGPTMHSHYATQCILTAIVPSIEFRDSNQRIFRKTGRTLAVVGW